MLRWFTTRRWFRVFHAYYHWNVEPRTRWFHDRVLFPIYVRLGGEPYEPAPGDMEKYKFRKEA